MLVDGFKRHAGGAAGCRDGELWSRCWRWTPVRGGPSGGVYLERDAGAVHVEEAWIVAYLCAGRAVAASGGVVAGRTRVGLRRLGCWRSWRTAREDWGWAWCRHGGAAIDAVARGNQWKPCRRRGAKSLPAREWSICLASGRRRSVVSCWRSLARRWQQCDGQLPRSWDPRMSVAGTGSRGNWQDAGSVGGAAILAALWRPRGSWSCGIASRSAGLGALAQEAHAWRN